jgi:LPXTG-motif cell wall-anchored protein
VTPSRDPTITSFTAQPPTVHVGNVTVLTVKVSGGTAPYKYAYTGLPSGCGSTDRAILNCTPTVNGTYSVNVTVTDVQGRTVRSSLVLEVLTTSSGSSPNSGWSSLVPWLLVVGIAVVAVVALALLIRRRRARGHGTPPTPSSEPSQPFA